MIALNAIVGIEQAHSVIGHFEDCWCHFGPQHIGHNIIFCQK